MDLTQTSRGVKG